MGFTLIELMIVVAIIGLLASVAIPAFLKYVKRVHTAEALINLRKIYDGEITYFDIDHVDSAGFRVSAQFVSAGPEPVSVPSGTREFGNWSSDGWTELKFATDSATRFMYEATATGVNLDAMFTARAQGDLDGDQVTSLFERVATINSVTGQVEGGGGVFQANQLE